jgi:hypothetical protein
VRRFRLIQVEACPVGSLPETSTPRNQPSKPHNLAVSASRPVTIASTPKTVSPRPTDGSATGAWACSRVMVLMSFIPPGSLMTRFLASIQSSSGRERGLDAGCHKGDTTLFT